MYLALRPPWASDGTAPSDAGVVASAPSDGGVGKKKKRRPGGGGGVHRPGPGGEDEDWLNSGGGEETEPPRLVQLSAADRGLEWRGDDTTPPKQTIDMNGAESRSLDNGEIQSTISSQSGGVQSCVVKAAGNTDLSGTITVKMVVDGNGRVTRSRVQAPRYMFSQGLLACVQGGLRSWKFPATGAPTLVTLPVNLTVNR
jgi:hypothetical protein